MRAAPARERLWHLPIMGCCPCAGARGRRRAAVRVAGQLPGGAAARAGGGRGAARAAHGRGAAPAGGLAADPSLLPAALPVLSWSHASSGLNHTHLPNPECRGVPARLLVVDPCEPSRWSPTRAARPRDPPSRRARREPVAPPPARPTCPALALQRRMALAPPTRWLARLPALPPALWRRCRSPAALAAGAWLRSWHRSWRRLRRCGCSGQGPPETETAARVPGGWACRLHVSCFVDVG
jgi:hypothetical protein